MHIDHSHFYTETRPNCVTAKDKIKQIVESCLIFLAMFSEGIGQQKSEAIVGSNLCGCSRLS